MVENLENEDFIKQILKERYEDNISFEKLGIKYNIDRKKLRNMVRNYEHLIEVKSLEGEVWKPVIGFEDFYLVSNKSRVKSVDRFVEYTNGKAVNHKGKLIKPNKKKNKYVNIMLCKEGVEFTKRVHRLVAEAFIPNPHNYPVINHLDLNPSNNNVENLEWCTHKMNTHHAMKLGAIPILYGADTSQAKTVYQYDLNWNLVNIWGTIKEAVNNVNGKKSSPSHLCNFIKQQKPYRGFYFTHEPIDKAA